MQNAVAKAHHIITLLKINPNHAPLLFFWVTSTKITKTCFSKAFSITATTPLPACEVQTTILPVAGQRDYLKNAEDPELDSNGIEFVLAKFEHIFDGLPFRVVDVLPNACVGIHARSSIFGN